MAESVVVAARAGSVARPEPVDDRRCLQVAAKILVPRHRSTLLERQLGNNGPRFLASGRSAPDAPERPTRSRACSRVLRVRISPPGYRRFTADFSSWA